MLPMPDRSIQATWDELGMTGKQLVRDLWRQKVVGYAEDTLTVQVGPRGFAVIAFYR